MTVTTLARVRGCLLGATLGDALGAPFEGQQRPRADPARGYGPGSARVTDAVSHGLDWEEAAGELFGGHGSSGNGGAMRVAPIRLLAAADGIALRDVLTLARRSAAITHAHPVAQDAAALQAAAVAFSVTSLGRHDLGAHAVPETTAEVLGNRVLAHESVPAAVTAWLAHIDLPLHALRYAIALGGDTDTIASMTGALAGARSGTGGWPQHLLTRLEDLDRITDLATPLTHRLTGGEPSTATAPRAGTPTTSERGRRGNREPRR